MKTVLTRLGALAVTVLLLTGTKAVAQDAGSLDIKEWVKGDAVELSPDKTYVVEFWATWCPPCRESIPHLTEMARKYEGKVTFIGISDEPVQTVKPFVEKMGEKMDYVVAVDDNRKTTAKYMEAYGVGGIPHAFVVSHGKVVGTMHPMEPSMTKLLDRVTSDGFDQAAADTLAASAIEGAKADSEMMAKLPALSDAYGPMITTGTEVTPEIKAQGQKIYDVVQHSPEMLNQISWSLLTSPQVTARDLDLIKKMAGRAVELTEGKDPGVLDTLARAHWDAGEKDKAIEVQQKAVAAIPQDAPPEAKQSMEATLASYKSK